MYSQEYYEKVKLFKETIKFEKTSRVPNISNFFTWKICDSEFTFKEALYDYKKMEKIVIDFHKRYDFDAYMDLGTRNPMAVTDALGEGSCYYFNEQSDSICVIDKVLMSGDEYLLFAQDPNQFIRLMFKRKYPKLSANELSDSISKYMTFGQYAMKVTKKMSEKYSRPTVFEMMSALLMPIEFFNSVGRGIKGLSIDARKHKSELIEALNAYYDIITQPSIDAALKKDNTDYVTDCYTALLAYSTLSVGQFEELYWPHLKKYLDQVIAANKTIYIYCESTMERFCEYFQDYPKGHIVMHLELDDPIQIRKKLPNVCLAGGMTTDLLGHGTSQQCIDKAKMLIDSLGSGYMMSQNKMMSFKNDCKRENLLALNEFLRNYR